MLRKSNVNNPIIAYYNINSIRNKIHDLRCIISKALPDILVLAETKIDESFPTSQFLINEYNVPTRCDRTNFGGGIIEFSRKGIIQKRIKSLELTSFESICSEITVKNVKWFLLSVYRSPISTNIKTFFLELAKTLDIATSRYDNLIVMGDLNIDVDDPNATGMQDLNGLLISYDLTIITKGKTCTTWGHESSLDIILTNKPKSHMHTTSS